MDGIDNISELTDKFGRIASPCIDTCTLDDDDICVGCFRNIDEICAWGTASDAERRQILKRVAQRREDSGV